MTSLLARRRRAEEFARLLEEGRASHDSELADLVELTEQLRPADVGPSQDFRGALRTQLMAEAAAAPHERVPAPPVPDRRRAKRRNRIIAVASSVAIAGGMVGTAAASHEALPGETLYGLKRGLESTSLALANDTEAKGRRHLERAHNRLAEVASLVGDQPLASSAATSIRVVTDTLGEFGGEAQLGGDALLKAYRQGGKDQVISHLRGFTTDALADLDQLEPLLPAQLTPTVDDARRVLTTIDGQAAQLCPNCAPASTDTRVTGDLAVSQDIQGRASTPSRNDGGRSLRADGRPGQRETGSDPTSDQPGDPAPPSEDRAPRSPGGPPVPETTPGGPPAPGTPTPRAPLPSSPDLPDLPTPSVPQPPAPEPGDDPFEIRIGDLVIPLPLPMRADEGGQPADPDSTELPSPPSPTPTPTPSLPGDESSGVDLPGN